MSYATLVNTCNGSTLAEQSMNKPNYTPGKALKKTWKLLKRVFKSAKPQAVIEQEQHQEVEATTLNFSILTTCSTLSDEECENELNEFAELVSTNKSIAAEY